MKRIIRLTESDLTRIVKRVLKEEENIVDPCQSLVDKLTKTYKITVPAVCSTADGEDACMKELMEAVSDVATFDNMLEITSSVKSFIDCKIKNKQFAN
jgi:imidazolonepropionase-like amidohydrolase